MVIVKNPRLVDLSGRTFGEWRVLGQDGNAKGGGALWRCQCSCGAQSVVRGSDLRRGKSASCGHAKVKPAREKVAPKYAAGGESNSRLYRIWQHMKWRCYNERCPGYKNYGARGIEVCEEWRDSYLKFSSWARASGYADHLTIERVDNDQGYHPGNCTWADRQQQSENRRCVARAPDGRLWRHIALENGISDAAYKCRLWAGWDYETASTWPPNTRRKPQAKDASGKFISLST